MPRESREFDPHLVHFFGLSKRRKKWVSVFTPLYREIYNPKGKNPEGFLIKYHFFQ